MKSHKDIIVEKTIFDFQHTLSSYALELLAIAVYEKFKRPAPGGITEKKIINGIFELLKDCGNIEIAWEKNYKLDDYEKPYV